MRSGFPCTNHNIPAASLQRQYSIFYADFRLLILYPYFYPYTILSPIYFILCVVLLDFKKLLCPPMPEMELQRCKCSNATLRSMEPPQITFRMAFTSFFLVFVFDLNPAFLREVPGQLMNPYCTLTSANPSCSRQIQKRNE